MTVPKHVYLFLVVGLIAASQSGNLIRLGDAHPVAISAWRLLLATVVLVPLVGRRLGTVRVLTRGEALLLVITGVLLAVHFFAWILAVQLTTVANASMFFSINPVITATAGYFFFKEHISKRLFLSIALGIGGVAVIGGSDLKLNPENFSGDAAAVVCSALFSAYFLLGKKLRKKLSTDVYVAILYGIAAIFSFIVMLFLDLPLVDYTPQTWICFVAMALIPTLLGHTSFNNALRYIDAGRISTATLSEPLLAGIVAYFAWGESVTVYSIAGYALICLSVAVLVLERR